MRAWMLGVSAAVHGVVVLLTSLVPRPPVLASSSRTVELEVVRVVPSTVALPPAASASVSEDTPAAPPEPVPGTPRRAPVAIASTESTVPATQPSTSTSSPDSPEPAAPGESTVVVPDLRPPSLRESFRAADGPPSDAFAPPPSRYHGVPAPSLGSPRGGGTYQKDKPAFKATVARDGKVRFKDKPNWQSEGVSLSPLSGLGYAARFDVTDYVYREIVGDDPYLYEKMKFLDETREVRDELAVEARDERLRAALAHLPALLDRAWSDSRRSVVERRQILFQLWDECSESGDEEVVGTARAVRATILGFIRRRLPAGSPAAYSAEELEALNAARQSREEFRPYSVTE